MTFSCPSTVIVAKNAIEKLTGILRPYQQIICVTDEVIHSDYGEKLRGIIGFDPEWVMASSYQDDAPIKESAEIIVGFGGGRSLDVAKLIAARTGLEWISVPTAASHDGIASEVASVSQNGYRYSKRCRRPSAIVADLSIMSKAPPRLMLAGTGDILSKASSLAEWRLGNHKSGEPFNEEAFSLVSSALESVLKNSSLETLVKAEIDAGRAMCIVGSSRPCSGTEHAISHAMERRYQELHGLQVAFATPLCLHYLKDFGYTKHGPDDLLRIMRKRGLPTTLVEMKSTADLLIDDIHHALEIMMKRDRYSVLKGLEDNALVKVISELYEGP
jgi:glycerol-1-phosphate dehydrogenase [NAD(P)+]